MNRQRIASIGLLLALCAVMVFTAVAAGGGPTVYFTDNMASTRTDSNPTTMETALLNHLNGATVSIDVSIYDFNRDSIRDALIAAHDRSVAVRVITDDEARHYIASYIPYYEALENAGIPLRDDDRESTIMHNKYLIIDGDTVWTGSTNMTNNGFTLNHNNAILFESVTLAALYQSDFDQMWVGNYSVHKSEASTQSTTYNGKTLELYFSPKDDGIDAMVAAVNSAETSIEFAIFFLTSDPLSDALRDALIARARAGVQIRGVWDKLGASNAFSDDESLCEAGVPIKIEDTTGKMHNKFMVIDAAGSNPKTITGSMNWSSSGDTKNDENTLIYHDGATAMAYQANFNAMWNALTADTQCEIGNGGLDYKVFLPIIIKPGTAPANVKIKRIVYNPAGSDVAGELVELTNSGGSSEMLTDWTLRDEANTVYLFPSVALAPNASIRVWVKTGANTATDLFWGRGSSVWNNNGDTATLQNGNGATVDFCSYAGGDVEANCMP